MTTDTELLQPEPETESPEPEAPETPETEKAKTEPEVAIAVGLALMKNGEDRGDDYSDYMIALGESTFGRSFIDELTDSFNFPDWLAREIAEAVLKASGHTVDDSTDLAPLVAIVQKEVKQWNECDDEAQCSFGGKMFVAGRLSHEAEKR